MGQKPICTPGEIFNAPAMNKCFYMLDQECNDSETVKTYMICAIVNPDAPDDYDVEGGGVKYDIWKVKKSKFSHGILKQRKTSNILF